MSAMVPGAVSTPAPLPVGVEVEPPVVLDAPLLVEPVEPPAPATPPGTTVLALAADAL